MKYTTNMLSLLAATATALPADDNPTRRQNGPQPGVVISQCTKPGVLALTYDDGPWQYGSELIDILDHVGAKATFFFTGTLYGCIYDHADVVSKAFASGHQVASHTWTHPDPFDGLSADTLVDEMDRLDDALVNIIGEKPLYVRPPYLQTGGVVLPTLGELGFKVVTANVDSGDWDNVPPAQALERFVQAGAQGDGHIGLMHETYEGTVRELTPSLIAWASENGLELVTVAECLDDADGAYREGNFTGNGDTTC